MNKKIVIILLIIIIISILLYLFFPKKCGNLHILSDKNPHSSCHCLGFKQLKTFSGNGVGSEEFCYGLILSKYRYKTECDKDNNCKEVKINE